MRRVNELSLEFVNKNFYNIGEVIYRKDGRSCSNCVNKNGYYRIKFKSKEYLSHRILWILYNQQELPEGYLIDHIDRNRSNNIKENLRVATSSENIQNTKLYKNNTTGIKGISIKRNRYSFYFYVQIWKNKKRYAKLFPYTPEGLQQATIWLKEQRELLHGEFARSE